jgi:hypothetical protein
MCALLGGVVTAHADDERLHSNMIPAEVRGSAEEFKRRNRENLFPPEKSVPAPNQNGTVEGGSALGSFGFELPHESKQGYFSVPSKIDPNVNPLFPRGLFYWDPRTKQLQPYDPKSKSQIDVRRGWYLPQSSTGEDGVRHKLNFESNTVKGFMPIREELDKSEKQLTSVKAKIASCKSEAAKTRLSPQLSQAREMFIATSRKLADCAGSVGNFDEARMILLKALPEVIDQAAKKQIENQQNLFNCLDVTERLNREASETELRGRKIEAIGILENALSIRKRNLGPSHVQTALQEVELARANARLGRRSIAMQHFEHGVSVLRANTKLPDSDLRSAMESYADFLKNNNEPVKADKLYEELQSSLH